VDPYNFPQEGSHSEEAQAFVISMHAGYREWQGAGEPITSLGLHVGVSIGPVAALVALVCMFA